VLQLPLNLLKIKQNNTIQAYLGWGVPALSGIVRTGWNFTKKNQ